MKYFLSCLGISLIALLFLYQSENFHQAYKSGINSISLNQNSNINISKNGGLEIQSNGERFKIIDHFSLQGEPISFDSFSFSEDPGWTVDIKETEKGYKIFGENEDYSLVRNLEIEKERITISDIFSNKTSEEIGFFKKKRRINSTTLEPHGLRCCSLCHNSSDLPLFHQS